MGGCVWDLDKCCLLKQPSAKVKDGFRKLNQPVPAEFSTDPSANSTSELVDLVISTEPFERVLSYNLCERWRCFATEPDGRQIFNNPFQRTETTEEAVARQQRCVDRVERALRFKNNGIRAVALQEVENSQVVEDLFATEALSVNWRVFCSAFTEADTNASCSDGSSRVMLAINDPHAVAYPAPSGPLLGGRTVAAISGNTLFVSVQFGWIHKDDAALLQQLVDELVGYCKQVRNDTVAKENNSSTSTSALTSIVFVGDFCMEDYTLPDVKQTLDIHKLPGKLVWAGLAGAHMTSQLFTTGEYTSSTGNYFCADKKKFGGSGEGEISSSSSSSIKHSFCTASDYALRVLFHPLPVFSS